MKRKTTLLFLLILPILLTLSLSTAFAQYEPYMQVGLPEGAKARFGQGSLVGRIAYSSNVTDTWIAVASHIGIWIYDAGTWQVRNLLRSQPNLTIIRSNLDGSVLAAGFRDGTVKLWDISTGALQKTFTGHSERVTGMRFSLDGSILATRSRDSTVRLWNVPTGTLHHTFEGDFRVVYSLSFSPDGSTLAVGFDDGVHLWDVATGALRNTFHTATVLQVHFGSDSNTFATWGGDGVVRLWDGTTGTSINAFTVSKIFGTQMRFNSDGSILATWLSGEAEVHLLDAATGVHRRTLHVDRVYDMRFSPDGRALATGSWDGIVRLWDVDTGVVRQGPEWKSLGGIRNMRFSPDGSTLAIGLNHGTVRLLDVPTGIIHEVFTGSRYSPPSSLSFNPDGSTLAIGFIDTVRLWDVSTDTVHNVFKFPHPDAVRISSMSFSPDGNTLAAGMERSYLTELPGTVDPSEDPMDVPVVGAAEVEPPIGIPTLSIWDVTTGEKKPFLGKYVHNVYSVCFSSDGRTLAVAADQGGEPILWDDFPGALNKTNIDFWDTSTGAFHKTLEASNWHLSSPIAATEVCFSPNGRTLAAVDGNTTHLWDVSTGILRTSLTGHTNIIFSLSFSSDGSTLATGSWDGTVRLWDVLTGTLHKVLTVGPWGVRSVSFSPNGDLLATGSTFGTVILWEVDTSGVTPTPQLVADVNGDGVVNIQDLVMVFSQFGQTGENDADVNGDGVVNIQDLVLVAAAFGDVPAAPIMRHASNEPLTPEVVQQWLAAAKQLTYTDANTQRGIAVLQAILTLLIPEETTLLPNYPNPFNPETWIPYQLAAAADVSMLIYSADGKQVRTLKLGQQAAGIYKSRNRAAYWDGRNEVGEAVASGVYFYTLKAGDFNTTRKMLIQK